MAKLTPSELGSQAAERVARGESGAKFWDWKERLSPDDWTQARQSYVETEMLLSRAARDDGSRTSMDEVLVKFEIDPSEGHAEVAEYYDNLDTSEHVETAKLVDPRGYASKDDVAPDFDTL